MERSLWGVVVVLAAVLAVVFGPLHAILFSLAVGVGVAAAALITELTDDD